MAVKFASSKALDKLLLALDAAPVGPEQPILRTPADNEHYETLLTFAVRKRQAAEHHLANVERLLVDASGHAAKSIAASLADFPAKPGAQLKASLLSSETAYVHELCAFLAALRSGLDFLANAAGRSLKGVTTRSMHKLEQLVEKGFEAPVLSAVKIHSTWLKDLRDYRDDAVHHLVVQAPAAGWAVSHHGVSASAILPIVVPRRTPQLAHDTRRSRSKDIELPHGLALRESHASVTYPDGSHKVLEHDIVYEPAPGFARIEQFMADHLAAYDELLCDMFDALTALKFAQVAAAPKSKVPPTGAATPI